MIVYDDAGVCLLHKKFSPGNTATDLGAEFMNYYERKIAFTSGGTTAIAVGNWIVGATGGAIAEVVDVTVTSGTWAGGDAVGVLRIKGQAGTFQSENLNVGASTNLATIAGNSSLCGDDYMFRGMQCRAVLVEVISNNALANWDGGTPDQTSLAGHTLYAGGTILLKNPEIARKFKIIDRVVDTVSTVNVSFYF